MSVRSFVGLYLGRAISRRQPEGSIAVHNRLAESFREFFLNIHDQSNRDESLYLGTLEVLNELVQAGVFRVLRQVNPGIGSLTLDWHGLLGRFINLKRSDGGPGEPNLKILWNSINEVVVNADNSEMIEETVLDILMAVNARVNAVGIKWGYRAT